MAEEPGTSDAGRGKGVDPTAPAAEDIGSSPSGAGLGTAVGNVEIKGGDEGMEIHKPKPVHS